MECKEERKIPVFTVIKKGTILKNILILHRQPLYAAVCENEENPDEENEEDQVLLVGRHPECNAVLLHPSVSRFHLQINCRISSLKLFVTDLASVHGTWVSEKKIEPGIPIEVSEGDTLRLGYSTRIYRLHWVPLSIANDMEKPFVSPSDLAMIMGKDIEFEDIEDKDEVEKDTSQEEGLLENEDVKVDHEDSFVLARKEEYYQDKETDMDAVENKEIQCYLDSEFEPSLYSDANFSMVMDEWLPFSPLKFDNMDSASKQNDVTEDDQLLDHHELAVGGFLSEVENRLFANGKESSGYISVVPAVSSREIAENFIEQRLDVRLCFSSLLSEDALASLTAETLEETENQKNSPSDGAKGTFTSSVEAEHDQISSVEDLLEPQTQLDKENKTREFLALHSEHQEGSLDKGSEELKSSSLVKLRTEYRCNQMTSNVLSKEMTESRDNCSVCPASESVNLDIPTEEVPSKRMHGIGNKMLRAFFPVTLNLENMSSQIASEKKKSIPSIWLRRGNASALHLQTNLSETKTTKACEDVALQEELANINQAALKAMESAQEVMEEDTFTPNEENYTPNTSLTKSSKNQRMLQEITTSGIRSSSAKSRFRSNIRLNRDMYNSSNKENQRPGVLNPWKSASSTKKYHTKSNKDIMPEERTRRVPLQALSVNYSGRSLTGVEEGDTTSVLKSGSRSCSAPNCIQGVKKKVTHPIPINLSSDVCQKRWTMVADTSSLLDMESRKSIQLLQGLKGTHLTIPRIVLRELDCLKYHGSLFRRKSEAAAVLEWIEECIAKKEWWISLQSSLEEEKLIKQQNGGLFSIQTSCLDSLLPTAEDYILKCAVYYRKMKTDGQLVLLSNDVTRKIKAMAEGLICETAQEFRKSLVNPFSERFLWAKSTPRGFTWSVADDVVLKEIYYGSPTKRWTKKEGAKGLKLILMPTSRNRARQSVNHSVR